jgi:hypothetical protein
MITLEAAADQTIEQDNDPSKKQRAIRCFLFGLIPFPQKMRHFADLSLQYLYTRFYLLTGANKRGILK